MKASAFYLKLLVSISVCLFSKKAVTQVKESSTSYWSTKLSAYFMYNGGWGISGGFGFWQDFALRNKNVRGQPAVNLSVNYSHGKGNLGNRDRYKTDKQLNVVISPMMTIGGCSGIVEELHPFYFGNANAVYAGYRHSLTFGSNFVLAPRALKRNVFTNRNRTQQLIYVGVRFGISQVSNIQLHVYDDFLLTDNRFLQAFADNYDRFFTGGGNLQVRFNQWIKTKIYSEVYTGNFQRDLFDFPDLYLIEDTLLLPKGKFWRRLGITRLASDRGKDDKGKRIVGWHPRIVAQEPGQKLFNFGRTFIATELSLSHKMHHQFILGEQGSFDNMQIQNTIHNWFPIDKIKPDTLRDNPNRLFSCKDKRSFERLHHFYPATRKPRLILGVSSSYTF